MSSLGASVLASSPSRRSGRTHSSACVEAASIRDPRPVLHARGAGSRAPRPMSLCLAPRGELCFLLEPVGAGTIALAALERGDRVHVFGPLGNGFRLDVPHPLLVGGGIGIARCRTSLRRSSIRPRCSGFGPSTTHRPPVAPAARS